LLMMHKLHMVERVEVVALVEFADDLADECLEGALVAIFSCVPN
jgi:hypothetical protein